MAYSITVPLERSAFTAASVAKISHDLTAFLWSNDVSCQSANCARVDSGLVRFIVFIPRTETTPFEV